MVCSACCSCWPASSRGGRSPDDRNQASEGETTMTDAWLDLLLAWMFGNAADPRPTNYFVRLLDTTGTEISTGAWTDYAPVAIARNGGFGSPGAGAGGRRQVASSAGVEFSEAAQVP